MPQDPAGKMPATRKGGTPSPRAGAPYIISSVWYHVPLSRATVPSVIPATVQNAVDLALVPVYTVRATLRRKRCAIMLLALP